jgi:hypothetical protein
MLKHRLHPGMNKIVVEQYHRLKLRYLNDQDGKLTGWFQETQDDDMLEHEYEVYLALTGEQVPGEYCYCTSHQLHQGGGYFLVHAFD